jgi:hypothetical protein
LSLIAGLCLRFPLFSHRFLDDAAFSHLPRSEFMSDLGEIVIRFGGQKRDHIAPETTTGRKIRRGGGGGRNARVPEAPTGREFEPAKKEALLLGVIDVLEVLAWQPSDSCQDRCVSFVT